MRVCRAALLVALATPIFAQDDEGVEVSEDPAKKPPTLNEASGSGILALREAQGKDGSWETSQALTGLALHTLSVWGIGRKDPAMVSGLAWLHKVAKEQAAQGKVCGEGGLASVILALTGLNRQVAARPMALSDSPNRPPRGSRFERDDWRLMHEYITLLTKTTKRGHRGVGGTRALQDSEGGWGPGSPIATTHLVLTALREAMLAGYPVEPEAFTKALRCVRKWRERSGVAGAYSALPSDDAKGMVCAWICRESLARLADPKHPVPDWSRALTEGMPQVSLLLPEVKGRQDAISCDGLWAIEQLGSLTGTAEFGGVKWHEEGTRYLLRHRWGVPDREGTHILNTCFALLFLKRATAPLAAKG